MRWRTTMAGDRRVKRRFAFIPTRCNDGTTRWLEWVTLHQEVLSGWGWLTNYAVAELSSPESK